MKKMNNILSIKKFIKESEKSIKFHTKKRKLLPDEKQYFKDLVVVVSILKKIVKNSRNSPILGDLLGNNEN